MQKIALVSDIHGNYLALEAVAANIAQRAITKVINLGDHVSGPLWPQKTIDFLRQSDWVHIRGNHDRVLAFGNPETHGPSDRYAFLELTTDDLSWLAALPAEIVSEDGIWAFHGRPQSDTDYLLETVHSGFTALASKTEILSRLGSHPERRVMVCGHTHIPRCVQLANGTVIINPGSVGLQAYHDPGNPVHSVENGSPHARYTIITMGQQLSVEFIALEYDWQSAAQKAHQAERSDWVSALNSGYVQ